METSVDNIEIYTKTAPQYAMNITAVDADNNAIDGAQLTVTNSAGEAILPETTGTNTVKYMLTEGNYTITVTVDGYAEKAQKLELTPALDSKDVKIIL